MIEHKSREIIHEQSEEEDYLYSSSDERDLEVEYFGEELSESSNEEGAWEDSESQEEFLRRKHKFGASWLNNKQPKKEFEVKEMKLIYNFNRLFFKTNFNIKLIKSCKEFLTVVDTMNNIYFLKENKLVKSLKIERFKIDDLVEFNKKIYLLNSKCGFLKEIDEDFVVDNVEKKFVRSIRKAIVVEFLYLLGDTTVVLNQRLSVIREYYGRLVALAGYQNKIVAINSIGDLLLFSKELVLEKKIVFSEGVLFTGLYSSPKYLIANSDTSMYFINQDFTIVKECSHFKNPVKNIVYCQEHYFCFSSVKSGVKILDKNLNFNNFFPKKKIRLPETSLAVVEGEGIYLCSHRDLHFLGVKLE